MISFSKAADLARDHWDEVDYCSEERDAFIFWPRKMEMGFGGWSPVVVMKGNGECVSMADYTNEEHDNAVLREGPISSFLGLPSE